MRIQNGPDPLEDSRQFHTKLNIQLKYSENWDHGIWSHHCMANRWGNNGNSERLYFLGLHNHCRWWLQPSNEKILAPWKKSYDQPRQQLNKLLVHDPAITTLSNHPKELKIYVYIKTCTWRFTEALSIITKTWKPSRCLLVGQWINKLVHPDHGILFSSKKKWPIKPWKDMEEI